MFWCSQPSILITLDNLSCNFFQYYSFASFSFINYTVTSQGDLKDCISHISPVFPKLNDLIFCKFASFEQISGIVFVYKEKLRLFSHVIYLWVITKHFAFSIKRHERSGCLTLLFYIFTRFNRKSNQSLIDTKLPSQQSSHWMCQWHSHAELSKIISFFSLYRRNTLRQFLAKKLFATRTCHFLHDPFNDSKDAVAF